MEAEFTSNSFPLFKHVGRYLRRSLEPELEDFFSSKAPALCFAWTTLLFKLRSFIAITVTVTSIVNVILAVGFTALCNYLGLASDLPLTLISAVLVFPISFGMAISFNFQRREATLHDVAPLKALSLSLFAAARDWPQTARSSRNAWKEFTLFCCRVCGKQCCTKPLQEDVLRCIMHLRISGTPCDS